MTLLRIAWQGVAGFPVRTILTAFSLVVGIVGIVTVFSASGTVEASVTQRALLANGPASTVTVTGLESTAGFLRSEQLEARLQRSFGPHAHIARVVQLDDAVLVAGPNLVDCSIVFTEAALREIRPFPIVSGGWIRDAPGFLAPRVVVNSAFLDGGGLTDGLSVRIGHSSIPILVAGTVEDGSASPVVYISLADVSGALAIESDHVHTGFLLSGAGLGADAVKTRLRELDSYELTATDWGVDRTDTITELSGEVAATRASFLVVGVLGLVAAIAAIANVGLSALRERSSELSLRRALGARRWHILAVMIVESQIIALLAGAAAVPLSAALYSIIAASFGAPFGVVPPPYPWPFAFAGLLIGMVSALVGSATPAMRAIRVPIASVMRE